MFINTNINILAILLSQLFSLFGLGMSQVCYASNGIALPDYGSCGDGTDASICCAAGQICLSNGLCAVQLGVFYSGGCTDKSYKATVCPKFCASGEICGLNVIVDVTNVLS